MTTCISKLFCCWRRTWLFPPWESRFWGSTSSRSQRGNRSDLPAAKAEVSQLCYIPFPPPPFHSSGREETAPFIPTHSPVQLSPQQDEGAKNYDRVTIPFQDTAQDLGTYCSPNQCTRAKKAKAEREPQGHPCLQNPMGLSHPWGSLGSSKDSSSRQSNSNALSACPRQGFPEGQPGTGVGTQQTSSRSCQARKGGRKLLSVGLGPYSTGEGGLVCPCSIIYITALKHH